MRTAIFLVVLSLLAACSHQARKVDCDAHLTVINPPTPMIKATATPTPPPNPTKP